MEFLELKQLSKSPGKYYAMFYTLLVTLLDRTSYWVWLMDGVCSRGINGGFRRSRERFIGITVEL